MKSDELKHYDKLIAQLLDGELSELEREQLMLRLEGDEDLQSKMALHLELSELLSRESPSRSEKSFLDTAETHLLAKETEEVFVRSVLERIEEEERAKLRTPYFVRETSFYAAVAAIVVMAFVLYWTSSSGPVDSFAVVTYSEGLDKSAAAMMLPNSELIGQELEITSGIVRVELSNGASITLEGPAAFLIESPFRFHLRNGRMSAYCPPSAHGFTVLTSEAEVIDLGTSFGVQVDGNGDSKVVVFDGEVKVEDKNSKAAPRHLNTGDALQITQRATEKIQFDGYPYRNIWPVHSGILHTSGSVIPPPPNILEELAFYENDDHMLIFPENRRVKLEKELLTTKVTAGQRMVFPSEEKAVFTPDPEKRYTSYLLHFNPVGERKKEGRFARMQGVVVFSSPIVAILAHGKELMETDELFNDRVSKAMENAGVGRGLEGHGYLAPGDAIRIHENQKRIRFDFYAGSYFDEIRIIVEER